MSPIDWDTELARLEREFDRLPAKPAPAGLHDNRSRPSHVRDSDTRLAVWARLVLVAALAAALPFWPYARACGAGLLTFTGAGAMIVVSGLWVATCTWRSRMGFAHSLALALVLVGLAVVGHQVLPRVGYVRVDAATPPQWHCTAPSASRSGR